MKQILRTQLRMRISSIDVYRRALWSSHIAAHATTIEDVAHARHVALYLSKSDEVDTTPLITMLRRSGTTIYIPRITPDHGLEFCELDPNRVTLDTYHITVPDHTCPAIDPNILDLIIVPCLGLDHNGTRLGRGKGYYDRFLATINPHIPRIALAFSSQVVPNIPRDKHDQLIYATITEQGIISHIHTVPHV